MQEATLAIAVLGLVLSVLSLGWQAASFVLEGGRIKATFSPGAANFGGLVTIKAADFNEATAKMLQSQGYNTPVVAVQVRNVGRLPVTVTSWTISATGGTSFQPIGESIGPQFPHRLQGGESVSWAVNMRVVKTLVDANISILKVPASRMKVGATVTLGSGRSVKAKGTFKWPG